MTMKTEKPIREFRRRILPAKLGALLLMLLFLGVAAWSWLFPATPQEQAALSEQEWENMAKPSEDTALDAAEDSRLVEDDDEVDAAQVAAAYFAAYRLDREEARGAELAVLEQIIADENSSPEAIAQAEQRRLDIAAYSDGENQAESQLFAKGFGETVVILGEQQATVIVDIEMDAQKATQIAEVVDRVSGCGFENVVVVNR